MSSCEIANFGGGEESRMNFWEQVTSCKSAEIQKSPLLYHYTTLDTFCALAADDGDFYCTHFNALNDDAEVILGELIAEQYLKRKYSWTEDKCFWFRANYRKIVKNDECVVPWIMSFSRESDSLSQWVSYTDKKKGGVAIGFDRDRILNEIDRRPGCYQNSGQRKNVKTKDELFQLRLVPCLYEERDAVSIESIFDMFLTPYKDVLERLAAITCNEQIGAKDFQCAINVVLELSSVIKHQSFENEQEERLVLLPMTNSCSECVMIGGKPRWKTHINDTSNEGVGNPRLKGLRGMMREVVISPHGDHELLMTSIKVLRNKYGMDFCKIRESQSPYNGR